MCTTCILEVCIFLFPGQFFNREIKDYKWLLVRSRVDGVYVGSSRFFVILFTQTQPENPIVLRMFILHAIVYNINYSVSYAQIWRSVFFGFNLFSRNDFNYGYTNNDVDYFLSHNKLLKIIINSFHVFSSAINIIPHLNYNTYEK